MSDAIIKNVYLARRNPRLARGQFPQRWRDHGSLALSLPFMDPCIGYFHNDVEADPPREADVHTRTLWTADYDGVGVVLFHPEDMSDLLVHPDFPVLLADEYGVFDHLNDNDSIICTERAHKARIGSAAKFFMFLVAKAGVDRASFADRWLAHVELVMRSPELSRLILRYVHAIPLAGDDTARHGSAIGDRVDVGLNDYAGIAEVGFASRSDMEAYLGHPDRAAIRESLEGFADLDRSILVATNEVTMKATAALR